MLSSKFAWNDFFTGNPATTLGPGQYSSRQTPSASSVYVSKCLFNNCVIASGNGGALYCTSVTYLFVELSSFFSCKTNSGQSGAIYLSSSNCLQSVLYAVCGYDCSSTSAYCFTRLLINNAASNMNCVNYTSITRSGGDTSSSGQTLRFDNGKNYCPSVNISMNKCYYISGVTLTPFTDSNSVTSSLSYSTFANNSASERNCIWCNRDDAKYEIKCCNIIRNAQYTSAYGTIFARGNLVIEDSCILENTANYIFYQEKTTCTITLSNCTIDSTTNNRNLIVQNTVTKSFIHGLNHMSTHNCHSEFDSVEYLTPIPYVSHSAKKTFCYYYTCKNQYPARMSNSLPLYCVFIFTFIHPNYL
jgi:hypothetical protein